MIGYIADVLPVDVVDLKGHQSGNCITEVNYLFNQPYHGPLQQMFK